MRRALRRAAQVYVAAGALGLVSPALAQSSHAVGMNAPAPAPRTVEPAKVPAPASEATLDEIQVELAWLANAATFHHTLGARVVGGSMEVRGCVPSMTIKDQAVRVAQQHTTLQVVDRLQINPNMVIPIGGGAADAMTQQASAVLAEGLGDQAAGLEARANGNGVIIVKGTVRSMEDKLTASRQMRQVSGCSAVVNLVRVSPVPKPDRLVAQRSADGSQSLDSTRKPAPASQPMGPPPTPVKPPVTAPTPAVAVTPTPVKPPVTTATPATVVTPTPVKPPVTTATPATVVTPTPVKPPVSSPTPAAVVTPAPVVPDSALSKKLATQSPTTVAKPSASQPYTSGAVSTTSPAPLVVAKPATARGEGNLGQTVALAEKKTVTSSARSDKPAAAKDPTTTAAPAEASKQLAMAGSKSVDPPPTTVNDKPATPGTPWAAEPANAAKRDGSMWPAAYQEKSAHAGYATSGTVVFDDDLTPTPAPKLKPMSAAAPAAPGLKPVVTSSPASPMTPVVKPTPMTTAPAPMPATVTTAAANPFAPLPTSAASELKQQVEKICGKQARDVKVEVTADKMLHVMVKVDDAKAQLALTDKILQLPEMATPNVRLELQVSDKK
jgi:hypothetical protein